MRLDPEAVVRARGLDPAEWWAEKVAYREWQQGKNPCHSMRATLRRRVGPALAKDVCASFRRLGKVSHPAKPGIGGGLAELHLNDAHIAAWANGDPKAYARSLFLTATRLAKRAVEVEKGLVERFLLVVNGDWLHADTIRGETTKGTRLEDVAVPYEAMFAEALGSLIGIVSWMAGLRPTEVQVIPGNHDFHSLYAVGQALKATYAGSKRVELDVSTKKYRYVRWGCTLLGFAHGDTGRLRDLPGLMAAERPKDWGETTWREWHTGHQHADAVFEKDGVRIRSIAALTKRNQWAENQGYAEVRRGAEAFLWHAGRGYVGHLHEAAVEVEED